MATTFQVTFDCAHPPTVGRFWAAVLGYVEQPPPEGFESWEAFLTEVEIPRSEWDAYYAIVDPAGERPRFFFQRVPEPKTAKNRMHLDVNVGGGPDTPIEERKPRVNAEAERLVGLGATRIEEKEERGEYWIVMQDVEGNEFCLQ